MGQACARLSRSIAVLSAVVAVWTLTAAVQGAAAPFAALLPMLQMQSVEQPDVTALGPIAFDDLRVEVRVIKASGVLVENWSAERIASPQPAHADPGRAAAQRRPRRPDMTGMGEAVAVQVDPAAWARAAGAGSLEDLAGWAGVCCREVDEIADRISGGFRGNRTSAAGIQCGASRSEARTRAAAAGRSRPLIEVEPDSAVSRSDQVSCAR